MTDEIRAVLYSDVPPSAEQESRFKQFLKNKYEEDVPFEWVEDTSIKEGFQLRVGAEVYDWSRGGIFRRSLRPRSSL